MNKIYLSYHEKERFKVLVDPKLTMNENIEKLKPLFPRLTAKAIKMRIVNYRLEVRKLKRALCEREPIALDLVKNKVFKNRLEVLHLFSKTFNIRSDSANIILIRLEGFGKVKYE